MILNTVQQVDVRPQTHVFLNLCSKYLYSELRRTRQVLTRPSNDYLLMNSNDGGWDYHKKGSGGER